MRDGLLLFICIMVVLSVVSFVYAETGFAILFIICAIAITPLVVSKIWFENHRQILVNLAIKMGLLPKPTEAHLFVLSFSFIGLLLFPDFRNDLWIFFKAGVMGYIFFIYCLLGLCFSIYFAFNQKGKTEFEKYAIKFYLALSLIALSITFMFKGLETKERYYWVFVLWNGIQVLVLFLSGKGLGGGIPLSSKNVKKIELIFGVIIVISILIVKFFYGMIWQVAVSIILTVWSIVEYRLFTFPAIQKNLHRIDKKLQ